MGKTSSFGPAQWSHPILVIEGVLLLDPEKCLLIEVALSRLVQNRSGVALMRSSIREIHFAQNQDVGLTSDRIGEQSDRLQHAIAMPGRGLAGAGTVEAPGGDVFQGCFRQVNNPSLGTHLGSGFLSINPDILNYNFH
jgi:hypothetical protein